MTSKQIILAVAGLPSSGKGTFAEIAEGFNFKKFVMGDVIRAECKNRGLEVNRKSSNFIMVELRREKGENAVAVITLEWILQAVEEGVEKILIDGIRSMSEIEYFNNNLEGMILIGIHASPKTRLKRALLRRRVDDAYSSEAFYARDKIELNVGIGDVIAKSDILITAENGLEQTKKIYRQVITGIIKKKEGILFAEN